MITFEKIRKTYRKLLQWMESHCSEIMPHEVFGLLGPKTAPQNDTFNMAVGLVEPDSGWSLYFRPRLSEKSKCTPEYWCCAADAFPLQRSYSRGKPGVFWQGLRGAKLKERVAWSYGFCGAL